VAPPRNRPKPIVAVGEVLMWVLFVLLLFPAGVVGWAVGHYTGHQGGGTRTVTVSATAPATTTAAAPTTTTAKAAATTTAAAAPTAAGKAIFTSAGCAACHTFKAAGATGKVGPDLDTAPAVDAKKDNMALAAFVRESIVSPNAFIAPGYTKGLMPQTFATTLSKAKIDTLVSFIVGGK
jgi:mono/diheme cytochrome c family protein